MLKFFLTTFFILFAIPTFSQTLSGTISDTLNNPLESANVIAKPLQQNASIKFAIADNKGRYKVELEKRLVMYKHRNLIYKHLKLI